jgi:hypothetical protein
MADTDFTDSSFKWNDNFDNAMVPVTAIIYDPVEPKVGDTGNKFQIDFRTPKLLTKLGQIMLTFPIEVWGSIIQSEAEEDSSETGFICELCKWEKKGATGADGKTITDPKCIKLTNDKFYNPVVGTGKTNK